MKKSRGPNFTKAEIIHLFKLVKNYPIIENKKTDGATTRAKHDAWRSLADEFNLQTNLSHRTPDNLLSCYKNQKIRLKRKNSIENTDITAPQLNAVVEKGQDRERLAQAMDPSSSDNQNTFEKLIEDSNKDETSHRTEINLTGESSPSQSSQSSIDPLLDSTPPENDCITTQYCNENDKRLNVRMRKTDPSVESLKKGKKKPPNVFQSFKELADEKKDLVKTKKRLVEYQIQHQQLQIELAQEKLQFEKRKNEMELEYLKQKYDSELELLVNKSNERQTALTNRHSPP